MAPRAVLVPGLLLAAALLQEGGAGPPPASPEVEPIGAGCADCHPAIVEAYLATGMARALEPLRPGEAERLEGLAAVREEATGFGYRFDARDGAAWMVETFAPPGAPQAQERVVGAAPIAFAVGAGLIDRAYVAERGGLFWFAPLEVLPPEHADAQHHAALAPGHAQAPGSRFQSPITLECLACHTDTPPPETYPLNALPLAVARDAEGWRPRGIGCGACHAGAEAHAAWRAADLAGEAPQGRDPVGRLAELSREARMSLCARCHLQGDARIALSRQRGLAPPGADLLEHLAVYVAAEHGEDVGFVSHTERLVLSPCYLGSGRDGVPAMDCGSCHDPHRSSFDPAERERVRAGCLACHPSGAAGPEPAHPCVLPPARRGERGCVDCHMRPTGVFDVLHVEIHDHFIRRDPPPPSRFETVRAKQATTPQLERFTWPGAPPPPLAGDPGLRMMALVAASQPDAALERVDERPDPSVFRLPMYHHLRGTLLEGAGRLDEARRAYERALVLSPGEPETLVNLGPVLARLGRAREGRERLDDVLRRFPRAEGALRNRALVHLALGAADAAAQDLEAAQRILPRAANAHALAELARLRGDAAAAEAWQAEERALDPRAP